MEGLSYLGDVYPGYRRCPLMKLACVRELRWPGPLIHANFFYCPVQIYICFSLELATHSNAIFDITWKPGGEQIVSYSIDITVCKCVSYCL